MNVVKEMRRVCVIKQLVEKDISKATQWVDSEVIGKKNKAILLSKGIR